jgi:hypothetical protein
MFGNKSASKCTYVNRQDEYIIRFESVVGLDAGSEKGGTAR